MSPEAFEAVVEQAFLDLPDPFRGAIDNVRIVVEDHPSDDVARSLRLRSKRDLLGLYQGIPLTRRGSGYGASPVVPDTISLYKKNLEAISRNEEELRAAIVDTLIHEIGHYFGMNEDEIRAAGY